MGRGRLSGRTKEGGASQGSVNPVHGDTYFVRKMQLFFFFFNQLQGLGRDNKIRTCGFSFSRPALNRWLWVSPCTLHSLSPPVCKMGLRSTTINDPPQCCSSTDRLEVQLAPHDEG